MWTDGEFLDLVQQWRRDIDGGTLLGPRILSVGPIVDGSPPRWTGSVSVASSEDGRRVVSEAKARGFDFVKVYTGLSRDAYFAIAETARELGIAIAGHVPSSISASEASNAGQRSIEHMDGVLTGCARRQMKAAEGFSKRGARYLTRLVEDYDDQRATDLFALFAANNTWICPTLVMTQNYVTRTAPVNQLEARLRYVVKSEQRLWEQLLRGGTVPVSYFEKNLTLVRKMHTSGVMLLTGTDLGNPYVFPGFSVHDELELLVKAGLTPAEALQTATINPARFLRIDESFGTVEVGKIADLVLLDANPLESISHTKEIFSVMLNGKLLIREVLQSMLADVETLASDL